ncbi:MAG: transcriptional repressor LexA [Deltaproteobacteria bacterium]|nr:transcriptional repressor LexA [Deltaproteobacteria bacterium]
MEELTDRQAEVLRFIERRIVEQGYPPTLREIGEELGIRSLNGVNDHLKALERKGLLARDGHRSRALALARRSDGLVRAALAAGRTVTVPLCGRVAAGEPILAVEQAEQSVTIDSFLVGDATRVYALKVVGDSMIEDGIFDGDFLFVRKQPTADRGSIVVAMIEGEATVKRFYPERDRIRFQPANSRLKPIYVRRSEFRETMILGTVVGVFRRV